EYDNYFLNIAIGYSGRQELVNAVRKICKSVKDDELDIEDINKDVIEENLYTADLPDPDLIIRTSGEERLSGFLLWQSAYSELYFCEAYWPEFDKINFFQAVSNFQERERRYGR
ncbi:UDP diphosphate synthase, partial [candidate division MSBL1 archaeon SCGC-AAA259M10]